ncbi:MAG: aminodeoxychorismate lyase [Lachnospiraceae bacterium]
MKNSKVALNVLSGALSVLILILILFAIVKVGTVAYDLGYRVFTEPALEREPGRDVIIQLKRGMSEMELGSLLEEKRLIDNGIVFAIQLRLSAYSDKLKPGQYTLNTSQTAKEMMQIMTGEEIEEQ